jgi:hypothetical protein
MKASDITSLAGKFVFPILMLIVGLALLITSQSITEVENVECLDSYEPLVTIEQTNYFKYAAYGFFALALIFGLFIAEVINRIVAIVLGIGVFPVLVVVMVYMNINSVKDELAWKSEKTEVYAATKQRMKDIRDAQLEYKVKYGRYAPNLDILVNFLRNDKVANIKKEGTPPDRKITLKEAFLLGYDTTTFLLGNITELQAVMLAEIARNPAKQEEINRVFKGGPELDLLMDLKRIVRDTTYVSVMDKLFTGATAKVSNRTHAFQLDSLAFRPYSGGKIAFWMRADSLQKNDSVYAPVFLVKDLQPYKFRYLDNDCKPRDTLMIGSLTSTSTNGNWK